MQSIHAQVLEKSHFALESRWNSNTSKYDTTALSHEKYKYSKDSLIFEIKSKEWEFKGNGIFDQDNSFEIFSKNGIKEVGGGLIQSKTDSMNLFEANPNGSLNWVKQAWFKTTYNGDVATKTTGYADFSAFGLGVIAVSEQIYSNPKKNFFVIKSYNLFPTRTINDSTLIYSNGKQDTLQLIYKLDEEEKNLVLSEKTIYKYNAQGLEIETLEYILESGSLTIDRRFTKEYPKNIKVVTEYEGMNTLKSLDSTYYDGIFPKLEKEYVYNGKNWTLSGKTEYFNDFKFKEGSPVPLAPTELTVSKPKPILKREEIQAVESYILTWKDNSYNETEFVVYRKLSTESDKQFKSIMKLPANTTTYTDNTANSELVYDYYVVALNGKLSSAPSNKKSSNITSVFQIADREGNAFIYPNPTKNNWNINGLGEIIKVEVINSQGAIVAEQNSGSTVEVSNLNQGVYMIKVQTRNGQTNYFKANKE